MDIMNTADMRSTLSGIGMPSTTNIWLSLGSSGSSYTAPANGYLEWNGSFTKGTTGSFRMTGAVRASTQIYDTTSSTTPCRCYIPIKKGQTATYAYENVYQTYSLNFVYAEGETS